MVRGNVKINKKKARRIEDGKVVKELPMINYNDDLLPLFSVQSPAECTKCGSRLNVNKSYERYVISSYGILEIPVNYWECSNDECDEHYHDDIVGVTGSNNYSDEYLDKLYNTRYRCKTSLFNTQKAGEILIGQQGQDTRAACPTTLWIYEQQKGEVSLEKLRNTDVQFDGTLYCDGDWIKNGWRKYLEKSRGKEFDESEWKKLRHKVVYFIATSDKVILDFQITDVRPPYLELIPLLSRIKERLGEENIEKIVSDEDSAIINAVKTTLPNTAHGFCIFHQLKNWTKEFLEQFESLDDIPVWADKVYEKGIKLIKAENALNSSNLLNEAKELLDSSPSKGFIDFKNTLKDFLERKYEKNRTYLEKGYLPDTNNVMEQLYAFIDDFVYQSKSFKTLKGLKNWVSNLAYIWNEREFNTGKFAGLSPLQISKQLDPG